jgi:hypothetical protein
MPRRRKFDLGTLYIQESDAPPGQQAPLGQVDASGFTDDPYWLPDAWPDIQVRPSNGNLEVVVSADNIPDGLHVLQRATAFADTHRTTADR